MGVLGALLVILFAVILFAVILVGGIELAPDTVAAEAGSAVAAALEHARGATARLAEWRVEAAGLRSRRQVAREEQQVAGMVGDLLRADNCPNGCLAHRKQSHTVALILLILCYCEARPFPYGQ